VATSSDPMEPPRRTVRCPGCGGASLYALANPYRPFCSGRCRGGDLGAWASEGYRVPASPDPEAKDSASEPPDP
jgi:endogenous inhibitor of DNA gyrase (YacG/DUF329 family)